MSTTAGGHRGPPIPDRHFRRRRWLTFGAASPRRAGPPRSSSPIGRRACSSRRCGRSRTTGRTSTTSGAWRARLNALPQFTTEIDGVDIHFIHVQVAARERVAADHDARLARLGHRAARDTIGPLTDPTAHGGRAEDAFDLVLPSLPGYGFSSEPAELGWDAGRTGRAWAELMHRLGYTRYVAQGGDVGALVTDLMGRQAVEGLVGYHLNLLTAVLAVGDHLPKESEQERAAAEAIATFRQDGFGYFLEMATRPQTIGYALLDSPVALAAWMLDHDTDSYYKIAGAFVDGEPVGQPHAGQHRRQHHAVLADRHRPPRRPGRTGRTHERWPQRLRAASLLRRSPCRSASPRSPARSGLPRAAGSRRSTPTSPTSTRPTRAATSPPGKSRSCSPTSSAQRSGRCVTSGARHEHAVATPTEIRPFHVDITEEALDDLRRRIAATRTGPRRRPSRISRRACRWR